MSVQKQRILYDATFIAENVNPKSRTGIYFVAYNTLKLMLKKQELEIDLFCESNQYGNLLKILKEIFPEKSFNIITELHNIKLAEQRAKLREKREKYKAKKKPIKKLWVQILQFINSIAYKFSYFLAERRNYSCYNVFFSPMYKVPTFLAKYKNMKKCVILYDLVPIVYPEYFPNYEKHWHKYLIDSINFEECYFAISEYTRQDFLKHCPQIDSNKIVTTLLACNESFRPASIEQIEQARLKYNIPSDKKYVFSLCTLEPRKNLIRTVKTFVQFIKKHNIEDMVFVLGGGSWEIFIDKLNKEIDDLGDFQDKILKIGYVADEDLAPLYSGAEWFTYTSQYEGFGLPPLEAMSCGTPVITSNNSSLPEVVGDAGIMIDWDSDEQHIEAYEKYYYNEELRKEFAQKGLERSKQFSWEKCVDEMLEKLC